MITVDQLTAEQKEKYGEIELGSLGQFNTGGSDGYGERTSRISFGTGKITMGDYVLGVANGKVGHIKRTALETLVSGIANKKITSLKIMIDPDGQTHLQATGSETFSMYTPEAADGVSRLVFGPKDFMPKITVKGSFKDPETTI